MMLLDIALPYYETHQATNPSTVYGERYFHQKTVTDYIYGHLASVRRRLYGGTAVHTTSLKPTYRYHCNSVSHSSLP